MEVLEQAEYDLRALLDLFAGPGGWEVALERLGFDPRILLGLEWSPIASTTARMAGFARLVADVSKIPVDAITEAMRAVLGSPPCQTFSPAGGAPGRKFLEILLWAITEIAAGRDPRDRVKAITEEAHSVLVLEPLRWAMHHRPTWTAWEQAESVLPLWEAAAGVLRGQGYSAWAGHVYSEQFDVPQGSRKRAILLASLEHEVLAPVPVRSRYYAHDPERLDPGVDRWLTIADVLPHRAGQVMTSNYGTGGDAKRRGMRRWDQPAFTVTGKINRNKWSDGTSVSLAEASTLQTFSQGHPWYGTKADHVWQQVGDAVPPMLAAHCLAALGVGDLDRAREAFLGSLDDGLGAVA